MTVASVPHVPLRRCVGCGKQRPQQELLRVAFLPGPAGGIGVGTRQGGRGAYLCRERKCVMRALARGGLPRVLRAPKEAWSAEMSGRLLEAVL